MPGATAVTVNVALDEPAGIVRAVGTVATAVLLLVSERLAPPLGAAELSVTVPCPLLPAATLVALSVTPDTVPVVVADVDEPPHWTMLKMATAVTTSMTNGVARLLICLMSR